MARNTFEETDARIANDLIKALDKHAANPIGWKMPWNVSASNPGNPITGRSYSGSYNAVVLMFAAMNHGGDQRFAGFGQWKKDGRPVKQGETGVSIFYPIFKCSACGKPAGFGKRCGGRGGCGAEFKKPADKTMVGFGESKVFNNQQTTNPLPAQVTKDVDPAEGFAAADTLVKKSGADLRHGGGRAFYSPSGDYIQVPNPGDFNTVADYWSTVLHECGHWTGHASRLAREGITRPDGYSVEAYAYEELVAEIAASFLCKHVGVERPGLDEQHVAYLASWRKRLSEDPAIIRRAVGEAGKVLRYLK